MYVQPVNMSDNFEVKEDSEGVHILLKSPLTVYNSNDYEPLKKYVTSLKTVSVLTIDFSSVENYDTYLLVFIKTITKLCSEKGLRLTTSGFSEDIKNFINVLEEKKHAIPVVKESIALGKYIL